MMPTNAADHGLQRPEAVALEAEDEERGDRRQEAGDPERDAEQEVEPDRRAEELGQVGGHGHDLRQDPEDDDDRPARSCSRQCSARFLPVAMPSLAERVCTSMAMRLLATITQRSM